MVMIKAIHKDSMGIEEIAWIPICSVHVVEVVRMGNCYNLNSAIVEGGNVVDFLLFSGDLETCTHLAEKLARVSDIVQSTNIDANPLVLNDFKQSLDIKDIGILETYLERKLSDESAIVAEAENSVKTMMDSLKNGFPGFPGGN